MGNLVTKKQNKDKDKGKNSTNKTPVALNNCLMKFVIIGDVSTGKTCIMNKFCHNTFTDTHIRTIGVDFKRKTVDLDNNKIKLQIWDTSGDPRFESITNSYSRSAHGLIIVYDLTNRASFDQIRKNGWIQDRKKNNCPTNCTILVGNKADLKDFRQVNYEEAAQLAKDNGLQYIETDTKSGKNIDELFYTVYKVIFDQGGGFDMDNMPIVYVQ